MPEIELVSGHPDIKHGTLAILTDTLYPAYTALFRLSSGLSVRKLQDDCRTAQSPVVTSEEITNAVRYAALLAKDSEFTPPEAAAFMRTQSASMEELAKVREQAAKTLEEIAEGMLAGELAETGESERSRRLALAYGGALLFFHELPALEPEPAEERTFRAALIPEDRALIEDYFRFRSAFWYWSTPEGQIGEWRRYIEEVEAGETLMVEYRNYLDHRDTLEDAITLLSPASAGAVEEMIRPLDRRFEAATEHSLALIRRDQPWKPRRWWHYRIPKRRNEKAEQWIRWREERTIALPRPDSPR